MTVAENLNGAAPSVVICRLDDLTPGRGAAVLVGVRQIAVFRLPNDELHAIDHKDPFTGANVIARGLLGTDADGDWYVASPLHKQRFRLRDGVCLDAHDRRIGVHHVGVRDGDVVLTV